MEAHEAEDQDLIERVKSHAEDGASFMRDTDSRLAMRAYQHGSHSWALRLAAIAATIVLGGAVAVGLQMAFRPDPDVGVKPSTDASPAATIEPSAGTTPSTESSEATASEEPWATPGPSATVPEGVAVLPGVDITTIAAALQQAGFDCTSSAGGIPGQDGGFVLGCTGQKEALGYRYLAVIPYWTAEGVTSMHVAATALEGSGNPAQGLGAIQPLVSRILAAQNAQLAMDWFLNHASDASCKEPPACSNTIGDLSILIQPGSNGAFTIDIVPAG